MITIGFSPHYTEALTYARENMERHQLIVLEEPHSPDFEEMLRGDLQIEDYIRARDAAFPEFDRQMCALLRALYRDGKRIVQIEPYLEGLLRIHELFSEGKRPEEILRMPHMGAIYLAEKEATAALLEYYAASTDKPFDKVIEAVKIFARADARRLNLRAKMRAKAIARLECRESIYVEAGNIHHPLFSQLRREVGEGTKVRVIFLLAPLLRRLGAQRRNLGPGDVLTLRYAFHHEIEGRSADLLAARSLISVKMISRLELQPGLSEAPHSEEEVKINRLVDRLDYGDCEELFDQIKGDAREDAVRRVENLLRVGGGREVKIS